MADLESMTAQERAIFEAGTALFQNPEVSKETKRLYKKINPKANFPELEIEDQIAKVKEEASAREKKMEEDLLRERTERRLETRRAEMRAKGYDPDRIEKIIVDYGAKDYETAMKIADMESRSAEPTAPEIAGPVPVDMRPEKEWKGMNVSQLRNKSASMAADLINGFRKNKRTA